jgi:S-adenosylhomocysteine hydrolase
MSSIDPRHDISLDPSPERQHIAGIGAEFDVMDVDPALNLSGLMRAFEVTRDDIAVLDDFNRLQVASGPGDIFVVYFVV